MMSLIFHITFRELERIQINFYFKKWVSNALSPHAILSFFGALRYKSKFHRALLLMICISIDKANIKPNVDKEF